MNPTLRNVIAFILGLLVGNIINMSLINLGHTIYPINGVDTTNMEELAAIFPTLEFRYFIFPFLAHAVGTFVGAFITAIIATSGNKMKLALGIGFFFLLGGIAINYLICGPTWFIITDILLAYLPMAWIGAKIAIQLSKKK